MEKLLAFDLCELQLFGSLDIDVVLVSMVTWTTMNRLHKYSTAFGLLESFNEYIGSQKSQNFDVAVLLT